MLTRNQLKQWLMIESGRKIPKKPGIYFFHGKNGRILYIGKAANLKNRLNSYFNKNLDNPRLQKMLETAESTDWQETDSEIEALILESQLIKKYRPLFNIMLRDDKQYFFVGFTEEVFPKVFITHQPKTESRKLTAAAAGPFTDGTALKATLKLLRRVFPYCTCKQKHNNYCLNYHIGNCPGFCCLKRPVANKQLGEYKKSIRAISEILRGKRTSLTKGLEKEMRALAQRGGLEKAMELRDKIEKLKRVFENVRILKEIGRKEIGGFGTLTELKEVLHLPALPKRIEGYDVSNIQGKFATGAMAVFIDGRPDKNEYRKFKIRIEGSPNDIAMLKEVLTRRFNHPEWPYPDLILIDGGKAQLNAVRSVILGHRKSLGLAMSINLIPIIALAKNAKHKGDHIYKRDQKSPIRLKDLPPAARNIILQIDAEAHRFAISYYRKLHQIKTGLLSRDSSPAERLG